MNDWKATLNGLCCALACVSRYMQIAKERPLDEVAMKNVSILLKDIEILKERYESQKSELGLDGGLAFLNEDTYFDGFQLVNGELTGNMDNVDAIIEQWIAEFGTERFRAYCYEVATYVLFLKQGNDMLDRVDVFGPDIARLEGRTIKKKARIVNFVKKLVKRAA